MELLDFIDLAELQKMQDMFSLATGMAAITVDLNGKFITKPSNFTEFCMEYTRKTTLGASRCAKCDAEGKGAYFCHAGLMDFAEPIIVKGVHLGNILGGQVLPGAPDIPKFEAIAEELGISKEEYIRALGKVTVRSEEAIRAASQLLRELVNNLIILQYSMKKEKNKTDILKEEIDCMMTNAQDIASKTQELTKISNQQNMLSLNASIEAARAGDAGRGFTIVAKRMGELAKSSAQIYSAIVENANMIHESAEKLDKTFEGEEE
ncbi:MAG: PocR ligand-binding domain-containing protein [Lachnospiraceae bacterium]|nr:PocR ligand-binding domain-containing protein [Lachnospiraceae bacterium]